PASSAPWARPASTSTSSAARRSRCPAWWPGRRPRPPCGSCTTPSTWVRKRPAEAGPALALPGVRAPGGPEHGPAGLSSPLGPVLGDVGLSQERGGAGPARAPQGDADAAGHRDLLPAHGDGLPEPPADAVGHTGGVAGVRHPLQQGRELVAAAAG